MCVSRAYPHFLWINPGIIETVFAILTVASPTGTHIAVRRCGSILVRHSRCRTLLGPNSPEKPSFVRTSYTLGARKANA